jgi:phage-related protein
MEGMNQLAGAGIPAWELLAEKMGVSMEEAKAKVADGTVGIKDLLAGMTDEYGGAMDRQSQTVLGQWSSLKENGSRVLTGIGEELLKAFDVAGVLEPLATALGDFATLMEEKGLKGALAEMIPPELQTAIVMIAGAIVGALVPAFVALIPCLMGLAVNFWAALAPLLPFIAAGAIIAGLAYLIITNWEGIKEFFVNLWTGVKDITEQVWQGISTFFSGLWAGIQSIFTMVVGAIQTGITTAWNTIQTVTSTIWNGISTFISNLWTTIQELFNTAVTTIQTAISTAWTTIQTTTTEVWTAISTWLSELWTGIQTAVSNAWNTIYTTISGIWTKIKEGFLALVNSAKQWGSNLINSFIDGIKSVMSKIGDTLSGVAQSVKDFLGFSSPTKLGPGREADQWAPNLVEMFAEGITSSMPNLRAAVEGMALSLNPNFAAVAASGGRGMVHNTLYVTVNGGWDEFERAMARRGVRFTG